MDSEALAAAVSFAGLVTLNTVATRAIARNDGLTRAQMAMQVLLTWTVPVLGAIVCMMVSLEPDVRPPPSKGDEMEAVEHLGEPRTARPRRLKSTAGVQCAHHPGEVTHMRTLLPLLLAATLALAVPRDARAAAEKFEGTLPATVEGTLVIDVPADEVEENEERIALATLTVDGREYALEIPEALAAKVPAGGGTVSVTLGEESLEFGFPTYKVTAVEAK